MTEMWYPSSPVLGAVSWTLPPQADRDKAMTRVRARARIFFIVLAPFLIFFRAWGGTIQWLIRGCAYSISLILTGRLSFRDFVAAAAMRMG